MNILPFKLERYFAKYEFSAPYLLSCSDCEALSQKELLEMAKTETLELWNNLVLGYTESQGHPLLREEIIKLYSKIEIEDVLVITPEEGIFIAMNTILEKGDHVITTFPSYQSLYEISNSMGCTHSAWKPNDDGAFNITDLLNLIEKDTRLIVINFPHNPTGQIISRSDLNKLVEIAREKEILVFSDEMYRFLEYDKNDRLPSLSDEYENAVSLFGMSKTFSLPGLRIGWLTTRNTKLMNKFKDYKDYTTICSSAPSEILALIGLQNKEQIIERNKRILSDNLASLNSLIERYSHLFHWHKPKAGSITFPHIKIKDDLLDFCENLVEEKGVMLVPSTMFDYDKKCVRFGFGRKNFKESLSRFEEYLQENKF